MTQSGPMERMRVPRELFAGLTATTQPTRSIRTLSGMCLVAIAAYGAAMTPPNNEGFSYWRFCPLVGRR